MFLIEDEKKVLMG